MTHIQLTPEAAPLWTTQQVADALKVNRETVLRWARNNQIPHTKNGRTYRFPPSVAAPVEITEPEPPPEVMNVD